MCIQKATKPAFLPWLRTRTANPYSGFVRTAVCKGCSNATPLGEMFTVRDDVYCHDCADAHVREYPDEYSEDEVGRCFDPTVCAYCNQDNGEAELPPVAGAPTCDACVEKFRARPFPLWIKGSFAFLLILLFVSLFGMGRYIRAARNLHEAENLLRRRSYADAAALLGDALKDAPGSAKAMTLKIKADLLSGDAESAYALIEEYGERELDEDLAQQINLILERVEKAFTKYQQAMQLDQEGKAEEALARMREAAKLYPESSMFGQIAESLEASLAFDQADYDRFLELNAAHAQRYPDFWNYAAGHASALACKYAKSGDAAFKSHAKEELARAEALARKDEAMEPFTEYAERIRHRLETREILTRQAYNERFRKGDDAEDGDEK